MLAALGEGRSVGVILFCILLMTAACSGEQSLVFSARDTDCESVRVLAGKGDSALADCLAAAIEAGRPVVWDLLIFTDEGDPIVHRFRFNGSAIVVSVDTSRDSFGPSLLSSWRCASLDSGVFPPAGIDCVDSDHDSKFAEAGLLGDVANS